MGNFRGTCQLCPKVSACKSSSAACANLWIVAQIWGNSKWNGIKIAEKVILKYSKKKKPAFSPQLWDYLGQEIAMTKISVPGQDWPIETVLKEFKLVECVWCLFFPPFFYYLNALLTSKIIHLFCFIISFKRSLRIIATLELIGKSIEIHSNYAKPI